jgi:hypothetical protein
MDELLDCLHRYLGLEWIYEEPSQINHEEKPLVVPPQEILLTLLEFATSGYVTDIHKIITQMKVTDQNLLPFANRIEQLTKNFQFEQIIELIKSSLKGMEK